MSHFLTVVIIPSNVKDIENGVAQALAPFDENKKVARYEKGCYCIGKIAQREALDAANREFGGMKELRERFWENREALPMFLIKKDLAGLSKEEEKAKIAAHEKRSREVDKEWQTFIAPRLQFEKDFIANHPKKDEPDPEFGIWTEEFLKQMRKDHPENKEYQKIQAGDRMKGDDVCYGIGTVTSRYNPLSKWDWWAIGGRFSGAFVPEYDPREDTDNMETCWLCRGTGKRDDELGRETREKDPTYTCNGCEGDGKSVKWPSKWKKFAGDVMVVRALPKDFTPFAIVAPGDHGLPEWMERGKMGWWAVVSNEMDEEAWSESARKVFKKFENHVAVAVDCHI